jgi:hypothetical protein
LKVTLKGSRKLKERHVDSWRVGEVEEEGTGGDDIRCLSMSDDFQRLLEEYGIWTRSTGLLSDNCVEITETSEVFEHFDAQIRV